MKRFFVLLSVVLILAALLTVPVCAVGISYSFEVLPSVQTLPVFVPESSDPSTLAFCTGFLPAGSYDVVFFSPAVGQEVPATSSILVPEFEITEDGSLASSADCTFELQGQSITLHFIFYYDESDTYTYLVIKTSDGTMHLGEGCYIMFTLVTEAPDITFKDVVVELFGPYEQQTETVTQTLADGSTVTVEQRIPGIAGLDYEWIASVALFALVLFSFFRLLGGLFKQ